MRTNFDIFALPTPYYIVDEALLISNLQKLKLVIDKSGCRVLLAQKAFSMFSLYPLIASYLHGTTASSLFEAKLGREYMGGDTHIFSPAYHAGQVREIVSICDHIVFNSFNQWQQCKPIALKAVRSCGLRINPECSTQAHAIYDPCAPGSRLGITLENFQPDLLEGIEGLHFHTLCEQNSDALALTVQAVEEKFGQYLAGMRWINFGGGHHITRDDYNLPTLIGCIKHMRDKYGLEVYLEPGEAIALNTGFLVTTVMDIVHNHMPIAILDTSAACHMPDVLEMPYRPPLLGSGLPGEKAHTYRLGGPTCLAGDIIGDYSFSAPLKTGQRLVFGDMAHYTMVKNNTFNGINLPSIAICRQNGQMELVKNFAYEDFKSRLS